MNPIIQRELVGTLRTTRALVVQLVLVAALAAMVMLRWPGEARVDLSYQQSRQVLRVFAYGLMVGLMLLAPVFAATTIVRERQQGTLALLLNSPMKSGAILFGKLVGSVGFVLLLVVLSLPAAAACYSMGGVALVDQLLWIYLILLMVALQYGTLAVLVSTYASTTHASLRLTYGLVLVLAGLTQLPHLLLESLHSGPIAYLVDWVRCISPLPAIMQAVGDLALVSRGTTGLGHIAERYSLFWAASIVLLIGWTARRLNLRLFDRPRPAGSITDERSHAVQIYRRIMYLWFFDPKRRSGLIGPVTNPVMVKEFRSRRFGRSHWQLRLVAGCAMTSLALMLIATLGTIDWGAATLGAICVLMTMGLILLLTPALGSGLISSERESASWQLLMMTPLSARTIVTGKLLSVAWPLALILAATLPAYTILYFIDVRHELKIGQTVLLEALTAVWALLVSAAVSSLFERTATATCVAYALLIGLCAGTMLVWMGHRAPFSDQTVQAALSVNPLAAALSLIGVPGFAGLKLVPQIWWFCAVSGVICLLVLLIQVRRLTRPL